MAAMRQNAMRLSPKWFSMVNSSPLGNASMPALRSVRKNPHAQVVRSRVTVKTVSPSKSQWTIIPDPIITLQPCHHPLPHDLASKYSSSSRVCFFNQLSKIFSGPIKMLYQCNFHMLWSSAVRETGRMAASYVAINCEACHKEPGIARSNRNLRLCENKISLAE